MDGGGLDHGKNKCVISDHLIKVCSYWQRRQLLLLLNKKRKKLNWIEKNKPIGDRGFK